LNGGQRGREAASNPETPGRNACQSEPGDESGSNAIAAGWRGEKVLPGVAESCHAFNDLKIKKHRLKNRCFR
jgi:hypothetical protein